MTVLLVLAGIGLTAAGIVLREVPRVVTGISVYSLLQFMGLGLLVYAWYRRRHEFSDYVKTTDTGKYVRIAVVLAWLLPAVHLAEAVISEIEEGKHYDRVAVHLAKSDPLSALTLASWLPAKTTESAPLRKRILDHLAKLGNRDSDVTGPLRIAIREDPDRDVRVKAVDTLGKLMTPGDVLRILRHIDGRDPETKTLLVQALTAFTGQQFGPDTAAWRAWFGKTWAGAPPEEAFHLAVLAFHDPGGDEALEDLAFRRIADGAGSDLETLLEMADDREIPALRAEAARLIGRFGSKKHAKTLGGLLMKESDEAAAAAQVAAIRKLDPAGADSILFGVADRAKANAGKSAALAALLGGETIDEEDPTALTALIFRRQKDRKKRNELLNDLMRLADDGPAARRELLILVRSEAEPDWLRSRALKAVLAAVGEEVGNDFLIDLLEKNGGRDFRESIRAELKKRTGKDFGLDAKAWREGI